MFWVNLILLYIIICFMSAAQNKSKQMMWPQLYCDLIHCQPSKYVSIWYNDLNTGLWLVKTGHVTSTLASHWSKYVSIRYNESKYVIIVREGHAAKFTVGVQTSDRADVSSLYLDVNIPLVFSNRFFSHFRWRSYSTKMSRLLLLLLLCQLGRIIFVFLDFEALFFVVFVILAKRRHHQGLRKNRDFHHERWEN